MTTQELEQGTLIAQMQAQLAAQQAQIAAMQQERNVDGDGSLQTALREFSKDITPTTFTASPCQAQTRSGAICGRAFDLHCAQDIGVPAPIHDHTFRLVPFEHEAKAKPRQFYTKDDPVQTVAAPETLEDTYLSEKQAAAQLQVSVPAVRKLVKDGQLKADRIGSVVLVRKSGVERIVALAEIAASEGMAQ